MEDTDTNIHLIDPLSEVSRRERKYLLGMSALGIAIVEIGIIPTRITALGVEFENADQNSFLFLIMGVVAYFLLGFLIYAWSDFLSWRSKTLEFYIENLRTLMAEIQDFSKNRKRVAEEAGLEDIYKQANFWNALAYPTSILRAIFEFVLPILISLYSIWILYKTANMVT